MSSGVPRHVGGAHCAADAVSQTPPPLILPGSPPRVARRARAALFFGFAFAVMADPVSSVAYAIEAALRALHGHLELLLPTMLLVVGLIALVTINYWFLVRRFPRGGGDAEAAGSAFGTAWAFPVIGALIVDFVLTIAISISAAASAIIAYAPALSDLRIPLALLMLAVVAAVTWFGHAGRVLFASFTILFLIATSIVLALGFTSPHGHGSSHPTGGASPALVAVILAFPVAMALATGIEAPLTSIAQLGQLDDDDRRRFGRGTLVLTVAIVGAVTLALTGLAVRLHVGIPAGGSTQIAGIARAATGNGASYAFFQLTSSILLLSAASSSYQAGPGLLKALARTPASRGLGILPATLGRTNRQHTPYNAVIVYLIVAALVIGAARAQEQELVLFYAVAVFASFLMGLLAMARFSIREHNRPLLVVNCFAIVGVALTLTINLTRGYPLLSLAATAIISAVLYALWVRRGRPAEIDL